MNRISTASTYGSVVSNLMAAQQRQMIAGEKVSTQKNGNDLKDFARDAEILTAMRSSDSRIGTYLEQNKFVADKLTTQDFALNQISSSVKEVAETIRQALASGRGDTLMQDLQGFLNGVTDGLNARYGGKYVFSGGRIDTPAVTAEKLSDLTDPLKTIADFFQNDDFITEAKVDDATTVKTGMLADDIGTNVLQAFKDMQTFEESADGNFSGQLTTAQVDFLKGVLQGWDDLYDETVNITARNGMVQGRVDNVKEDLTARQTTLAGMIGDITDADMALAATQLTSAQLAVQAASQVFVTLQGSSLLNVLQ